MATIPFSQDTFRPLCVKGNATAENPVEFELAAVGGASKARLKSMIMATSGLADLGEWSPNVQAAVISAFETGPGVFAEGVTAIRGLKITVAMALKVGIIAEIPRGLDPKSEMPITTGLEFARVCGFWPILAFEVAMAIARLSGQAEIDPRFFGWLSTSLGTPKARPGTAGRVEGTPGAPATAASQTRRGRRPRTT